MKDLPKEHKLKMLKHLSKTMRSAAHGKMSSLVKEKKQPEKEVQEGAKMSGMHGFLPHTHDKKGMEHQRAKIGEKHDKKKKDGK